MLGALTFWFRSLDQLSWPKLATHLLLGSQIPFTPLSCFGDSETLTDLITCLDDFTVPKEYYNAATYAAAQPTSEERAAWTQLVSALLTSGEECEDVAVPTALDGVYAVTRFTEQTGLSYCVLSESDATGTGMYVRGWGLFVVPVTPVLRDLHISAPHPKFDLGTPLQAAHLFRATGARSLLIPGRSRMAFKNQTDCVKAGEYYKTDPTHDKAEPFFDANRAIWEWQTRNGGCPSASCAFIQLHGKRESTCSADHMFLSSGFGNGNASKEWYTDATDRPIKRLQRQLRGVFPSWKISLPSDSACGLTATRNVVGRLINGVNETRVCDQAASVSAVKGEFIHIEQSPVALENQHCNAWAVALSRTFSSKLVLDVAKK
ncbi:hypothetical protein BD779DRAFT_1536842 [Infundibulicybe gibba]|nr:hypothetical protein BD779DRAFT_1536842 [Infundibulicybe gibba]